MGVNVFANFAGDLGYNIHSRYLTQAMMDINEDMVCIPVDNRVPQCDDYYLRAFRRFPDVKNNVSLAITYGNQMSRFAGKKRVGCTVWESSRLPGGWSEQMNQLDKAWAVTKWGKEVFEYSGVEVDIDVVPEGVPDFFTPTAPPIDDLTKRDTFKFLSIFKWERRKSPDMLLRAFAKNFADDPSVELFLLCYNPFMVRNEAEWQQTQYRLLWQEGIPKLDNLFFLPHIGSYLEMPRLYVSCDAFVLPTKGEGWGLPITEAMACGLPTIATNIGAVREYMNDSVGYLIDVHSLEMANDPPFIQPEEDMFWEVPDEDHLAELMFKVWENQTEAKKKGQKAAQHIAKNFSWAKAAKKAWRSLKDVI